MRPLRLVARLDIKGSNLIKGVNLEGLKIIGEPNKYALKYYENGIDELIFMDVVASLYGRNQLSEIIKKATKNIFVPITVGGGIRSVNDANDVLRFGADKIAINSAAIKNPNLNEPAFEMGFWPGLKSLFFHFFPVSRSAWFLGRFFSGFSCFW